MAKKKDRADKDGKTGLTAAMDDREMLRIARALSDPNRVEVFRRIAASESLTCSDMRECLLIKPATLSHHIKQLEGANLIETSKEGKFVRLAVRRKVWKSYLAHLKQLTA